MVICLERCADLHIVQLMPLPLTVSCFSKMQTGFTFLVLAHLGSLGQRAIKRVCVCRSLIKTLVDLQVESGVVLDVEEVDTVRRGTPRARQLARRRSHRPPYTPRLEPAATGGQAGRRRQLDPVEDVVERGGGTAPTTDVAAPMSAHVLEHRLNRVAVRVACSRPTPTQSCHHFTQSVSTHLFILFYFIYFTNLFICFYLLFLFVVSVCL